MDRVVGGKNVDMTSVDPSSTSDRSWLSPVAANREETILRSVAGLGTSSTATRIDALVERNRVIHEDECLNLNPASNVMNPRAEAMLAKGLGTRASLGHAGEKYEFGLEAIEEIEVIAASLVRRVFGVRHAELRVGSGALANLYAFMATCRPGDTIVVPPATIGGHITHRPGGAAGLYGLDIHEYAIDADRFTVDLDSLARLVERVRPRLITIGASVNLLPHPVAAVRAIADRVGATVMFDAAHACGLFAGRAWPNPLDEGADVMTMSTYKSLGGPAGGLVLTNRDDLAERLDAIAYPGLTANFDVATTAALAVSMLDWIDHGNAYATAMVAAASALADGLVARGLPLVTTIEGPTRSHQLIVDARQWGGGHEASARLRSANLLACAIGMPGHDGTPGLRLGTPEAVRWGITAEHMDELAGLVADALNGDPQAVAPRTTAFRRRFREVHFVHT